MLLIIGLFHGAGSTPRGAGGDTGFLVKSVHVDGVRRNYSVYLPPGYTPARQWPLIVFLHASGQIGRDGLRPTIEGIGPAIRFRPELYPCIVLFPQAPVRYVWTNDSRRPVIAPNDATPIVDAELDEVLRDYAIDEDRIYLTGVSMGAQGAYYYGARNTDRFAAIMPISGHPRYDDAPALAAVPVWIFHNARDPRIDPAEPQHMADLIAQDGGDVRITLYDSDEHNAWDRTYNDPEVIAWLLSQTRHPAGP